MPGRTIDWESHLHLESVDSTNNYIRRSEVPSGSWVTANEQTGGRGRGQHSWTAIGAERLIFSAKVELHSAPTPALPVRIGGAVLRACRTVHPMAAEELQLKWPNDIMRRGKKVGGILIEAESGKTHVMIIGIGINISGAAVPPHLPDAGFLFDEEKVGSELSAVRANSRRQPLARAIIAEINMVLNDAGNADACRAELDWIEKNAYLQGKKIRAKGAGAMAEGRVEGISDDGYLRLMAEDGSEFLLSDAASEIRIAPISC